MESRLTPNVFRHDHTYLQMTSISEHAHHPFGNTGFNQWHRHESVEVFLRTSGVVANRENSGLSLTDLACELFNQIVLYVLSQQIYSWKTHPSDDLDAVGKPSSQIVKV
jgi:hypothetical protein